MMDGINLSCEHIELFTRLGVDDRFTYLNTAPYALYLLPTYWRYRRGQLNV
jgi:hypothetical protein